MIGLFVFGFIVLSTLAVGFQGLCRAYTRRSDQRSDDQTLRLRAAAEASRVAALPTQYSDGTAAFRFDDGSPVPESCYWYWLSLPDAATRGDYEFQMRDEYIRVVTLRAQEQATADVQFKAVRAAEHRHNEKMFWAGMTAATAAAGAYAHHENQKASVALGERIAASKAADVARNAAIADNRSNTQVYQVVNHTPGRRY